MLVNHAVGDRAQTAASGATGAGEAITPKLDAEKLAKARAVGSFVSIGAAAAFATDGYDQLDVSEQQERVFDGIHRSLSYAVNAGVLSEEVRSALAGAMSALSYGLKLEAMESAVSASKPRTVAKVLTGMVSDATERVTRTEKTRGPEAATAPNQNSLIGSELLRDGQLVTDAVRTAMKDTAPIALLEGPTGVGKSGMISIEAERRLQEIHQKILNAQSTGETVLIVVPKDLVGHWKKELTEGPVSLQMRSSEVAIGPLSRLERQLERLKSSGDQPPSVMVTSFNSLAGMQTSGRLKSVLQVLNPASVVADEVHTALTRRESATFRSLRTTTSYIRSKPGATFGGYTATMNAKMIENAATLGAKRLVALDKASQIARGDKAPVLYTMKTFGRTGKESAVQAALHGTPKSPALSETASEFYSLIGPAGWRKLVSQVQKTPALRDAFVDNLVNTLGMYASGTAYERANKPLERLERIANAGRVTLGDMAAVTALQITLNLSDLELIRRGSGDLARAKELIAFAGNLRQPLRAALRRTDFTHLASAEGFGQTKPKADYEHATSRTLSGLYRGLQLWNCTVGAAKIEESRNAKNEYQRSITDLGGMRRERQLQRYEIAQAVDFPLEEVQGNRVVTIDPVGTANVLLSAVDDGDRGLMWTDRTISVDANRTLKRATRVARIQTETVARDFARNLVEKACEGIEPRLRGRLNQMIVRAVGDFRTGQLDRRARHTRNARGLLGEGQPWDKLTSTLLRHLADSPALASEKKQLTRVFRSVQRDAMLAGDARELFAAIQVALGFQNPERISARSQTTSKTNTIAVIPFPSFSQFEALVKDRFAVLKNQLRNDPSNHIDVYVSATRHGENAPLNRLTIDHNPPLHLPHLIEQAAGRGSRSSMSREYSELLAELAGVAAMRPENFPDLPPAQRRLLLRDPAKFLEKNGVEGIDPRAFTQAIQGKGAKKGRLSAKSHETLRKIAGLTGLVPAQVAQSGHITEEIRANLIAAVFLTMGAVSAYVMLVPEDERKGFVKTLEDGARVAGDKVKRGVRAKAPTGTGGLESGAVHLLAETLNLKRLLRSAPSEYIRAMA